MLLQEPLTIIILSAIFAFTIKIADLLDEHGLKLFKGSRTLFGILWGICLALLIISDATVGSFWLAILLYWILFLKIDYPNHALATVIILLAILWKAPTLTIDWLLLSTTFLVFAGIKYLQQKKIIKKHWFITYNLHLLLLLLVFVYYNPLYSLTLYSYIADAVVYYLTKHLAKKHGYP
ncbi:MAG: hypothetical protein Q7R56_03275 [Nanoarchaeota archaeon]|nr:hypothetical protein [Nanoarchaeota archaeon]